MEYPITVKADIFVLWKFVCISHLLKHAQNSNDVNNNVCNNSTCPAHTCMWNLKHANSGESVKRKK